MKKYLCLGNKKQKNRKKNVFFYVLFLSFKNDIRASVTVKIQSIKQ